MTVEALNDLALGWSGILWRASWQGAIAVALAWVVCRVPRIPAGARAWVWRLVALKLLLSLIWIAPLRLPVMPARPAPPPPPVTETPAAPPAMALPSPLPPGGETPAAQDSTRLQPAARILLLWLAGVCWGTARLCAEWRRAGRLTRSAEPIAEGELPGHLRELCLRLGLRRAPLLISSPHVHGPLLVGVVRPTVVLPSWLVGERPASEARLVLAHEAAHLKHRDLLWGWVLALAHTLFFYHPCVWLARREWHLAHEMACDERAVRALETPASEYGSVLLAVAGRPGGEGRPVFASVGVAESYQAIRARILALGRIRPIGRRGLLAAGALLSLAGVVGLVPWQLAARESVSPTPAKRATPAVPAPARLARDLAPPLVTRAGPYRFRLARLVSDPDASLQLYHGTDRLLGLTVAIEHLDGSVPDEVQSWSHQEALDEHGRPLISVGSYGPGTPSKRREITWLFVPPAKGVRSLKRFSADVVVPPGQQQRMHSAPVAPQDPPVVFERHMAMAALGWEFRRKHLEYPKGDYGRCGSTVPGRSPAEGESYLYARYHVWKLPSRGEDWQLSSISLVDATGRAAKLDNNVILYWSGRSSTGYAGWGLGPLTPERQRRTGASTGLYVVAINPGSPAQRAGIRPGDVVLRLGGKVVLGRGQVWEAVTSQPGKRVSVVLLRGKRRIQTAVALETRPLWEGIGPSALAAGRERLRALLRSKEGHFAEWRLQSAEPVPDTFTPVKAVATFTRPAKPYEPVRFEFRNVPIPADVLKALHGSSVAPPANGARPVMANEIHPVIGATSKLRVPPPKRVGVGFTFHGLDRQRVERLASGFAGAMGTWRQSEVIIRGRDGEATQQPLPAVNARMLLFLPGSRRFRFERANVFLAPNRNWPLPPNSPGPGSPAFIQVIPEGHRPGRVWLLDQTATQGGGEGYLRFLVDGWRNPEKVAVQKTSGYFLDLWDPLPGSQLPSGPKARTSYFGRYRLVWVRDNNRIEVFYGDETVSREEAREYLLDFAASLIPVIPNQSLGEEVLALLKAPCG